VVSSYHIDCGAKCLDLPPAVIREALESLDCVFWDDINDDYRHPLACPDSELECWSVCLQFGHLFAKLLQGGEWAKWLNPSMTMTMTMTTPMASTSSNSAAALQVAAQFSAKFAEAEASVARTVEFLTSKGFVKSELSYEHLSVYVELAGPIANEAVRREVESLRLGKDCLSGVVGLLDATEAATAAEKATKTEDSKVQPLFKPIVAATATATSPSDAENYGAWGFMDSTFKLEVDEDDGKNVNVVMQGSRYSIGGRKMPSLISFLEKEMRTKIDLNAGGGGECESWKNISKSELTCRQRFGLKSIVGSHVEDFSEEPKCRCRHGTGQSQEDIYMLRNEFSIRAPDCVVWPANQEVRE